MELHITHFSPVFSLSWVQILSSAPYSETPSICFLPLTREIKVSQIYKTTGYTNICLKHDKESELLDKFNLCE
jgi:hypothetical protein